MMPEVLDALFDEAATARPRTARSHCTITCSAWEDGKPASCSRGHIRLLGMEISMVQHSANLPFGYRAASRAGRSEQVNA